MNVPVALTDRDGDIVESSITIELAASQSPVVLDLNGDGVTFLSKSGGVRFDYDGDGSEDATAWVGADDGILVFDANSNRFVDSGGEIVFSTSVHMTDLQGLIVFDSNGDGLLSADDADFAKFGVWQDANSNGKVDFGEFKTLAESGILSISLTSDNNSYVAAGGDVYVHGEAMFNRVDGTTGRAADATFAVGNGTPDPVIHLVGSALNSLQSSDLILS
jgi:WD40 repeat protein